MCDDLKDKILRRIQNWHSKYLSYTGRVQLTISVLASIHVYYSRIFILPKRLLKEIDGILRAFLWAGVELKNSITKVVWVDVYVPKAEGGLGIPNIFMENKVAMAKHL